MNLAERALTGNITGPPPTPCSIFSAQNGTAVGFSVGLATNLSGYGLYNPVGTTTQSAVKAVLLEVNLGLSASVAAQTTICLAKFNPSTGTGTGFAAGASTGVVFQQGVAGTSTNNRVSVFGTGSTMITPTYVKVLYSLNTGAVASPGPVRLQGDIALLPGEGIIVVGNAAATGFASFTWAEVPL